VLRQAAKDLPGTTAEQLRDQVSSNVSSNANLIEITASAGRAPQAAAIANRVAESFLAERNRARQGNIERQRLILEQKLRQLAPLSGSGAARDKIRALERRIDELTVAEATAGSDLGLADRATAPTGRSSPRPLLASVVALFASLAIAVLVALAREHLSPRASNARDVGPILNLPVLAALPALKRRQSRRRAGMALAAERDGIQSLRAAVELATRPDDQKVIVVTSATVGEGKTTVTYRLATSLAAAGQSVLVVSGDLRRPEAQVGQADGPGVSELLAAAASDGRVVSGESLARATQTVVPADAASARLSSFAVIPSGEPHDDPAALLTRDLISSLFDEIGRTEYEWVLVDAPPLLGPADARIFAGAADSLLLVSRLGVVTLDQLRAARDELDRLEVDPLGVVVVGAPVEAGHELRRPTEHGRINRRMARTRRKMTSGLGDRSQ
jgi:Mrp family chromosome partitioning ATPase